MVTKKEYDELLKEYNYSLRTAENLRTANYSKMGLIRHMQKRVSGVMRELQSILDHPYGAGGSTKTRKTKTSKLRYIEK